MKNEIRIKPAGLYKDISGNIYDHLKAISYAYSKGCHNYWNCICTCCNEIVDHPIRENNLKTGNTKSCGCLSKEKDGNRIFVLTNHKAVIVFYNKKNNYFVDDLSNLPLIETYTWHPNSRGEPVTTIDGKDISLARLKLGIVDSDLQADHVNHNPRDNRSCNVRACTKLQNACNKPRGLGKIKFDKDANAYVLTVPDENGIKHTFSFHTKEEAAAYRHDWLNEHFHEFTYWYSQELAKKHRLYYFDPVEEIKLHVLPENGKYDTLFNEIKALPERSIFKIELRRLHDMQMNIALGNDPHSEEYVFDRLIYLLEEYAKFKTEQAA